ncbi:hypothetical protein K431DRAFT_237446 [Polychaeton citri CBS 116435]|uniref:Mediator of RNA polymerase II transcription subunit 1 n=1 Tax=Polychaeton citri CBS 116435 TaxID=1314669 RepID=A0A9P4QF96_9PEZI|nr:hypothetical protein K431DRAFT_237446 [Polychaeton citri CBS 116435]
MSSTPTPSSASKKVTGIAAHVSTPSHASPAPRSHPSPVATRKDHAGKTPINHPTTGSSQGTKTVGGTPMVQQLSRDGHSNPSPSGNILGFGTPAGLGVDLGTPGQLNMPTPAGMSAPPMNISMSELGLGSAGPSKRNEDDERRAKMRRVLQNIGRPKGKASEEGVARIARRVGFASDIDAETLSKEDRERKVGNRMFSIAGNTVQIDVSMEKHVPQRVDVTFSIENEMMKEQGEQAGRVLLQDLTMPHRDRSVAVSLDPFALNLGRLAKLDKISSDRINCFEAITGVYTSLNRLYRQQKQAVKASMGDNAPDEKVEDEVMRRRSGRPTANAHGKLGMAVEYWQSGPPTGARQPSSDSMDIDGADPVKADLQPDIYALRVEIQSSFASMYPPIRVTEGWLPASLDTTGDIADIIPWQDPPPTFLASGEGQGDSMVIEGADQQKLPDLQFVARLDPPIVMPWQTAVNLLSSAGNPQPPLVHAPYHHLLLTPNVPYSNPLDSTSPNVVAEHTVLSFEDGQEVESKHKYKLFASRLDYAYKLDNMPFSHPRQIIEALSLLRQWALVGILLRSAFSLGLKTNTQPAITEAILKPSNSGAKDGLTEPALSLADFEALLETNGSLEGRTRSSTIDVSFVTSPTPSFVIAFPLGKLLLAKIAFKVLPNAELVVYSQNLVEADEDGRHAREMAKALNVCVDIGVWVEWLRQKHTK